MYRHGFELVLEHSLIPTIDEVDFDTKLARALMHEAQQCIGRRGDEMLDWSNIYYYHLEPWAKWAESLTTSGLWNLIVAITTRVAMAIDDEDFNGDDWYGDDYSREIGSILDTLGNLCGLLVTRPDLTEDGLTELENLIKEAQVEDKIWNYMSTPYDTILELICVRREAEEVCCGLYDVMIGADFNREAGVWIYRKVDFVRSKGLNDKALSMLKQNLEYPEVCLKNYNELMAADRWQEAVDLLDEAQKLKERDSQRWFGFTTTDWLSMKQALLMEHGSKEMQIANLTELFYAGIADIKLDCYMRLKKLVAEEEWKSFYTDLLSRKPILFSSDLDSVALFLIIEEEYEWLYRELEQNEQRDKTDYRYPLKYASALMQSHNMEIRAMLVRTFREYAADRFAPKKSVSPGKYAYFCNDLQSLAKIGAKVELMELVQYFKTEYSRRSSLMAELRKIEVK